MTNDQDKEREQFKLKDKETEETIERLDSPKFNDEGDYFDHKVESKASSSQIHIQKNQSEKTILSFSNLKESTFPEEQLLLGNKLLLNGQLFWNKEIIIDSLGMRNGLRKKNDGQTFFGLTNSKDYSGNYHNDFVVNLPEVDRGNNTCTGRIFEISYQKRTNDYQLYLIHHSLVLNYEIENFYYFDQDREYYLMLGQVFMTVFIRKRELKKFIDVQIEIENEPKKEYTFSEDEAPITIGRINSNITIKSTHVSKAHAKIEYSTTCNQFYYKDLESTNGSTLVIKEDDTLKLKGQMKFKINDTSFYLLELP